MDTVTAEKSGVLADLALALTAVPVDLDDVLARAARAMRELVGDASLVRLADDMLAEDGSGWFAVSCADAEVATVLRQMTLAGARSATGAFQNRMAGLVNPFVVEPVTKEWLTAMELEVGMGLRPYLERLQVYAVLVVPLRSGQRFLGYMVAFRDRTGIGYSEDDTATAVDIAARVTSVLAAAQAVNLLRASEQRHRRIVETTAEGVWEFDAQGRTSFANRQMARMLNLDRSEVIGRLPGDFLNERDAAALVPPAWAAISAMGEQHELTLVRRDGTELSVHATSTALLDGNDERIGSLAMLTDVTDRVHTQELERQLDQMRRLDSLGQLAGGIAHDFNNLLVVIGGFAQVVGDRLPAGSPLVPYIGHIQTAASKGDALTRQLLAFGRGGTGAREVVEIRHLLTDLEPMLTRTLGEHIDLVVSGGVEPLWRVRSNRGQLEQVIVNLAANARDAMRGGGTLTIECQNATMETLAPDETLPSTEGQFVRIAVSDTGHGMTPEVQRRALEPFFTTKEVGQGTGLGLASVYGIVRGLGGKVLLYSEVDVGTTIKIFLPATDDVPLEAAAEPEAPKRLKVGRVLVVEDHADVGQLVDVMLEPIGADVTVVDGPLEALALLDEGLQVDLLITDVIMPDMTGPELVPRVRQRRPGLPVLYMSGYTAGVLGDRGQVEPGAELIEKPFTRNGLLTAIAGVLAQANALRRPTNGR